MELTPNIKRHIQQYEPVDVDGLTLYPVTMAEREEFEYARPAIDLVQQSMPPVFAAMPLLSAYYKMDYDAHQAGEDPVGLFAGALLMLALSLRLGAGLAAEERLSLFRMKTEAQDPSRLTAVTFWADGEEMHSVTPVQFQRLREIIAAQNGITLTSENANPELIEAERALQEAEGAALSGDMGEKIAVVCALCHAEEAEVEEWPILKFQNRAKSWQRIMGFMVCAIAQAQGSRWKGGNPYPSLFFERTDHESSALRPISDVTRGMTAQ